MPKLNIKSPGATPVVVDVPVLADVHVILKSSVMVYPAFPVKGVESCVLTISNVTAPIAPFGAKLSVHVITHSPVLMPPAVTVTTKILVVVVAAVTVGVVPPPLADTVHVVAVPEFCQIDQLAVILIVSVSTNAVTIPKVIIKLPGSSVVT